ncbi:MAG: hypothetical protein IPH79_01915 [Sphingomonadales bacterium]|nr:hypothetical protein [Sphingomonadales bacterium]
MSRFFSLLPLTLVLAACGGESAPADPAANAQAKPDSVSAKPASQQKPGVAAMDPAKLKDPCLFTKEEVGKTFGITITATEPETMGQMSGCTYKGDKGSLRINFIAHDPGYFDMAVASMKKMKPGRKVDFAGDPDGAWMQFVSETGGYLNYNRQNVSVEILPMMDASESNAATQEKLLSMRRIP